MKTNPNPVRAFPSLEYENVDDKLRNIDLKRNNEKESIRLFSY